MEIFIKEIISWEKSMDKVFKLKVMNIMKAILKIIKDVVTFI